MKNFDKKYLNAEKALSVAYNEKNNQVIDALKDERWGVKTMSRIKRIGPHNTQINFFELFGAALWRCAPVACTVIVLLSLVISNIGVFPEEQIAKLYVKESVTHEFIQIFRM